MSQSIEVQASPRDTTGTGNCRRLRHQQQVPAVVYGAGKPAENISLDHLKLISQLDHEAFYSQLLDLVIDGKKQKVILKALHRHPYKAKIMHVDFMRVKSTEAIVMKVPVHFLGEEDAPGVKEGGVISHNMTELEIKCLPGNLPQSIDIDASAANMDDVIHILDIKLPTGVELAQPVESDEQNHPVFSIHLPRVEAEEPEEAEAGDEAASAEEPKAEDKPAEDGEKS